jgi:hypothetical protein
VPLHPHGGKAVLGESIIKMIGKIAARLMQLNIELPKPTSPAANYAPAVISGAQVYVAGQLCVWNDELRYIGALGQETSIEDGQKSRTSMHIEYFGSPASRLRWA